MDILFFGIVLLVTFMVMVLGAPLLYYLKREMRWEQHGRTLEEWYR